MLYFMRMVTRDDIKALFEEEREHTAKIIDQKLEPINKKLDTLTSEVSHIKTAIKPLATKEDIELQTEKVKSEIQADIRILNANLITKVQKHDKSIKALHEGTGVPDPNTH